MSQGIVIGATVDGGEWLRQLLDSIHTKYSIEVVCDWEMNAIKQCIFDEFVFLPQSTEVLDNDLFNLCFKEYAGRSVSLSQYCSHFGMYLGKYRSELLRNMTFPEVNSKGDAVRAEGNWMEAYVEQEPNYVKLGNLPHTEVFVEKFGRLNMVTESQWLRRYKGNWQWNPSWQ
jgi:hypothetical protein